MTYPGHSDLVAETLCFPNINLLVLFLLTAERKKKKKKKCGSPSPSGSSQQEERRTESPSWHGRKINKKKQNMSLCYSGMFKEEVKSTRSGADFIF